MKLSDWFNFMLKSELDYCEDLTMDNKERFIVLNNEFWKFEDEDRDIVLEDLKKDEGILYKKMCDYNEREIIKELELNMVWWEYSLEDYFRDMFDKKSEYNDGFNLFELKDINRMMYGDDYNDNDFN